jgi:hypothetical protein
MGFGCESSKLPHPANGGQNGAPGRSDAFAHADEAGAGLFAAVLVALFFLRGEGANFFQIACG